MTYICREGGCATKSRCLSSEQHLNGRAPWSESWRRCKACCDHPVLCLRCVSCSSWFSCRRTHTAFYRVLRAFSLTLYRPPLDAAVRPVASFPHFNPQPCYLLIGGNGGFGGGSLWSKPSASSSAAEGAGPGSGATFAVLRAAASDPLPTASSATLMPSFSFLRSHT